MTYFSFRRILLRLAPVLCLALIFSLSLLSLLTTPSLFSRPALAAGELRFLYEISGERPGVFFAGPLSFSYAPKVNKVAVSDLGRNQTVIMNYQGIWEESMSLSGGVAYDGQVLYITTPDRKRIQLVEKSQVIQILDFASLPDFPRLKLGRLKWKEKTLYAVDEGNQQVLVIQDGTVARRIGGQGPNPGSFLEVQDLELDQFGNLYVTDSKGFPIQEFDPQGRLIATSGTRGTLDQQILSASGIAIDRFGQIWVADTQSHKIKVLDPMGRVVKAFGTFGNLQGQFNSPADIDIDEYGRIYVLEQGLPRYQVFILADPSRPFIQF